MQLIYNVIDFIFPKICLISDIRLDETNSNPYVSDFEINSLNKVNLSDLHDLDNKVLSDYSFSVFAFSENDNFSKILYQLKYRGMKNLGIYLGKLLGRELKNFIEGKNIPEFDYIIPVPLFKTKLRERGYNQSDFICQGINTILQIRYISDLVKRNRNTISQTKLNYTERVHNVKDAFEMHKKYAEVVFGKKIILVDDVVTTGSTLNEIIKVLKEHHCKKVFICTLAMAK